MDAAPFQLSLAVGTAQTDPLTSESLEALLQRADTAMYDAKLRDRARSNQPA
jgi:GGDEF domain-containing protein